MICFHILSGSLTIQNMLEELIDHFNKNNGLTGEVEVFGSGEAYFRRAEVEIADILFLDADANLGCMSAIAAAADFRKRNPHAKIIFLTANKELIADVLDVRPFAWIGKPICESKFTRILHSARRAIHSEHDKFWYRSNKEDYSVPISDLFYIESKEHLVIVHLENGETICYRDKLCNVYAELASVDFIQVSKSFVIHLKKVVYGSKSEFVMKDGTKIKVSRSFREKVAEKFRIFRRLNNRR